jgi:hypothetical protein
VLKLVESTKTTTRGVTARAETKRMTCEQVVGYLLEGEGFDFLSWVVYSS